MRFVENKENVVFLGTPGVGKTHLAVALGMIAASHRYGAYYINCDVLIKQLNKAHFENRLAERLNIMKERVLCGVGFYRSGTLTGLSNLPSHKILLCLVREAISRANFQYT